MVRVVRSTKAGRKSLSSSGKSGYVKSCTFVDLRGVMAALDVVIANSTSADAPAARILRIVGGAGASAEVEGGGGGPGIPASRVCTRDSAQRSIFRSRDVRTVPAKESGWRTKPRCSKLAPTTFENPNGTGVTFNT